MSKVRGNPFTRGTQADWYEPVGMGLAVIAGALAGSWRSLPRSPVIAAAVLAAGLLGTNLVLLGLRRRRQDTLARRLHAGCCTRCGYPRRGNVSGVCPECGTPVKPASDPAT